MRTLNMANVVIYFILATLLFGLFYCAITYVKTQPPVQNTDILKP